MNELDKLLSEVEENYGEWAIKKLIAIVKCQKEALEFVAMPLTNKNGTVESYIETLNNDYEKCKDAIAKSNAIAKGES